MLVCGAMLLGSYEAYGLDVRLVAPQPAAEIKRETLLIYKEPLERKKVRKKSVGPRRGGVKLVAPEKCEKTVEVPCRALAQKWSVLPSLELTLVLLQGHANNLT